MLWIFAVILLLVILICLLRIRIFAVLGTSITLILQIGPVRKQLYPSLKQHQKKPKDTKKQAKRASIPKPGLSDVCDAFRVLKPALIRALQRTRRGVCIVPLNLSVVLGGREDPAGTAERFGYINAVVWSVMPALECLLRIPDPRIHLDMDFDSERLLVSGSAGVSIRVGTLILILSGIAVPALGWLWKYVKRKDTAERQPLQASAA